MVRTPVSLLERLRRPGAQGAWTQFVELYTPLLYFWARRRGGRRAGHHHERRLPRQVPRPAAVTPGAGRPPRLSTFFLTDFPSSAHSLPERRQGPPAPGGPSAHGNPLDSPGEYDLMSNP